MPDFTASRSEKMESLSAGGLGWQFFGYLIGKLREGFPSLLARRWMSGYGHQC
jgi:hypothetical protein